MNSPKKSKGLKWALLYAITGIVDVAQFIMDLTGVGIAVSEFIEPFMPFVILGLLQIPPSVTVLTPKRLGSLFAVELGGLLTGGALPFWILDVWYIHSDVKREDAEIEAEEQEQAMFQEISAKQALYQRDSRQPYQSNAGAGSKMNVNGVRAPSGRRNSSPRSAIQPQNIIAVDFGNQAQGQDSSGELQKAA